MIDAMFDVATVIFIVVVCWIAICAAIAVGCDLRDMLRGRK